MGITCILICFFFFFKQKTAYEMVMSDWSSDVCSSDRSEEHTSELQSLITISYAVFCLDRKSTRLNSSHSSPSRMPSSAWKKKKNILTPVTQHHLVWSLLNEKKKNTR